MVDPQPVPAMLPGAPPPPGGSELVDWITNSTRRGRTIMSAIPPTYRPLRDIVIPAGDTAKTRADAALVEVLHAHTPAQAWRPHQRQGAAVVARGRTIGTPSQ